MGTDWWAKICNVIDFCYVLYYCLIVRKTFFENFQWEQISFVFNLFSEDFLKNDSVTITRRCMM